MNKKGDNIRHRRMAERGSATLVAHSKRRGDPSAGPFKLEWQSKQGWPIYVRLPYFLLWYLYNTLKIDPSYKNRRR